MTIERFVNPIILFRSALDEEGEEEVSREYLPTYTSRMDIPCDCTVIGRYSVLPYYDELEKDLQKKNCALINSWAQHRWMADVLEWASPDCVLEGLTPRTWSEWYSLPEGAYVLKGKTNSRKQQWNTRMFAPTKADIPSIARRLLDDSMIMDQGLVIREYIPLKQLGIGLNGLPITNEWRTFWLVQAGELRLLCSGFYWASHFELESEARFDDKALEFVTNAARLVSEHANFFVLDVAETVDGRWIVIEVNDGQMSGLSMCKANELYANLQKYLLLV